MKGYQVIYLIQAASGPIKIGIAADPVKRLMGLQSAHHEKLAILATFEGGPELESLLHARFARGHIRGEWFRPDSPGLPHFIACLLRDEIPSWVYGLPAYDDHPDPLRYCFCGWPIEAELVDRDESECWACKAARSLA